MLESSKMFISEADKRNSIIINEVNLFIAN